MLKRLTVNGIGFHGMMEGVNIKKYCTMEIDRHPTKQWG